MTNTTAKIQMDEWFKDDIVEYKTISLLTSNKMGGFNKANILKMNSPLKTIVAMSRQFHNPYYVVCGIVTFENGKSSEHFWMCDKNHFVLDFYHVAHKIKIVSYVGVPVPRYILEKYFTKIKMRSESLLDFYKDYEINRKITK